MTSTHRWTDMEDSVLVALLNGIGRTAEGEQQRSA
jgi:hypothetical protein